MLSYHGAEGKTGTRPWGQQGPRICRCVVAFESADVVALFVDTSEDQDLATYLVNREKIPFLRRWGEFDERFSGRLIARVYHRVVDANVLKNIFYVVDQISDGFVVDLQVHRLQPACRGIESPKDSQCHRPIV
jgi:hypothetical protein